MGQCPTAVFLDEVERAFSVVWPESFRRFCRTHANTRVNDKYPLLKGNFICDMKELEKTNVLIGEGSWGDYERAITGKRHPKEGTRLYLDFLPFFVRKRDVCGFEVLEGASDRVVVWAVHTFVHDYPTFDDWLAQEGSHSRAKKKKPR